MCRPLGVLFFVLTFMGPAYAQEEDSSDSGDYSEGEGYDDGYGDGYDDVNTDYGDDRVVDDGTSSVVDDGGTSSVDDGESEPTALTDDNGNELCLRGGTLEWCDFTGSWDLTAGEMNPEESTGDISEGAEETTLAGGGGGPAAAGAGEIVFQKTCQELCVMHAPGEEMWQHTCRNMCNSGRNLIRQHGIPGGVYACRLWMDFCINPPMGIADTARKKYTEVCMAVRLASGCKGV